MPDKDQRRTNGANGHREALVRGTGAKPGDAQTGRIGGPAPQQSGKLLPPGAHGKANGESGPMPRVAPPPKLSGGKAGLSTGRRRQLRAKPEERHVTSHLRGSGARFLILLLLVGTAVAAYLHAQGQLDRSGLTRIAQEFGAAPLLRDFGLLSETAAPDAARLTVAELTEIERLLDQLAFAPGAIDGVIDQTSSAAIRDYQALSGATANGVASRALLEELRNLVALQSGAQQ